MSDINLPDSPRHDPSHEFEFANPLYKKKDVQFPHAIVSTSTSSEGHPALPITQTHQVTKTPPAIADAVAGIQQSAQLLPEQQILNKLKNLLGSLYDHETMSTTFSALQGLNSHYEDYSDSVVEIINNNAFMKLAVFYLNDEMKKGILSDNYRKLVNEMVLFACVQPAVSEPHHPYPLFSFKQLYYALFELEHESTTAENFFREIDFKEYFSSSVEGKLFMLQTAQIKGATGTDLYKKLKPQIKKEHYPIYSSAQLQPQFYLNTCGSASLAKQFTGLLSIPAMSKAGDHLCNYLEKKVIKKMENRNEKIFTNIFGKGGITKIDFATRQLEKSRQELKKAHDKLLEALEKQSEGLSPKAIQQFYRRWSRAIQRISSIADPEDFTYSTKKPLAFNWFISALLMLFPALISSLWATSLSHRMKGANRKTAILNMILNSGIYRCAALTPINTKDSLRKNCFSWDSLFLDGGTRLPEKNHMLHLRAQKINGKKCVVLFDVASAKQKVYTLAEFEKWIHS